MILQIFQPEGSSLCGQTCVAMIAGVTLEESIKAFNGRKGKTRTREVVAALRNLGLNCGEPPLTRINGQCYPDTCIVKLRFDYTKNTHWVLWHEGRYYDPSLYGYSQLNNTRNEYPKGVRATSYLPIFYGMKQK